MKRNLLWILSAVAAILTAVSVSAAEPGVNEARVSGALDTLMSRTQSFLAAVGGTSFDTSTQELKDSAVKTACIQNIFNEFKDAYLGVLDHTALNPSLIEERDKFGKFILQIENDMGVLEYFVPSIQNEARAAITAKRALNAWVKAASQLGLALTDIHETDLSASLTDCFGQDYVNQIARRLPDTQLDTNYGLPAPRKTYRGWEPSGNGGIKPIFVDNPNVPAPNPGPVVRQTGSYVVIGGGPAYVPSAPHTATPFQGKLADFLNQVGG
jgi:hypothetical protein